MESLCANPGSASVLSNLLCPFLRQPRKKQGKQGRWGDQEQMKFTETKLKVHSLLYRRPCFFLFVLFAKEFAAHGLKPTNAQCSLALNHKKGTLRDALSLPRHLRRWFCCSHGDIYDVVIASWVFHLPVSHWRGVDRWKPSSAVCTGDVCPRLSDPNRWGWGCIKWVSSTCLGSGYAMIQPLVLSGFTYKWNFWKDIVVII